MSIIPNTIPNDPSPTARTANATAIQAWLDDIGQPSWQYVWRAPNGPAETYYLPDDTTLVLAPPVGRSHASLKADFAGVVFEGAGLVFKVGHDGREMVHTVVQNLYLGAGELHVHQCDHSTFNRCVVGTVRLDGPSLYGLAFIDTLCHDVIAVPSQPEWSSANHVRWVGGKVQQGGGMHLSRCAVWTVSNVDFSLCDPGSIHADRCSSLLVSNCYFEKNGDAAPGNHQAMVRLIDCNSPVIRDSSLNAANGPSNGGTHMGYAVHATGCLNPLVEGCSTQWALHASFRFEGCAEPTVRNCVESGSTGWITPLRVDFGPNPEPATPLPVPELHRWVEVGDATIGHDGVIDWQPDGIIETDWLPHPGGRLRFAFRARSLGITSATPTTYKQAIRVYVQQRTGTAYPLDTHIVQVGPNLADYVIEGDAPANDYRVRLQCRTGQEAFRCELEILPSGSP